MQDFFNQFFAINNGKSIEVQDITNKYQCMDLIFAWCNFLKIPLLTVAHLYAYQVWTQPTALTKQYFDLIPNSATNVPAIGDIIVFSTTVGYAGHVAVETGKSNSTNLISFDQNWGGKQYATTITHYNYYGILGWLHPKTQPVTDDQIVREIQTEINGGNPPTTKIANNISILKKYGKI